MFDFTTVVTTTGATLVVWTTPLLAALVLVQRGAWKLKVACFLAVALAVGSSRDPEGMAREAIYLAGAIVYFGVVAEALQRHSNVLAAHTTRPALLLLSFATFLWIPALATNAPHGAAFLPLAWELALSAYSFTVEVARRPGPRPSRASSLFFLLVDPTLVFLPRHRTPMEKSVAPRRWVAGCRLLWGALLAGPAAIAFESRHSLADEIATMLSVQPGVLLRGGTFFFAFYACHSSLASFRIGLLGLLGYRVPERYRLPFLATSPLDFWRRWNVYVGAWFKYYVFFPLARRFQRAQPRVVGSLARPAPVLVTFALVGVVHEFFNYADQSTLGQSTLQFLVVAAVVLAWAAVEASSKGVVRSAGLRFRTGRWRLPGRVLGPACVLYLLFTGFGYLQP